MIVFWIAAALLSAAAAALVIHFAGREPQAAGADPATEVYRRQLAELDDLAARGVLPEDERQAAHAEAARRLLGAGQIEGEAAPTRKGRLIVAGVALVAALAAAVVYLFIGAPGATDQPFKRRADQWEKDAQANLNGMTPEQLSVILKRAVEKNPNTPQVLYFLAMTQIQSGQVQLGIHNLRKVVAAAPNQPEAWGALGEALTMASVDQTITPEANAAFKRALELDPKAVLPRFYMARAKAEAGDRAGAVADLKQIQASLPPGAREGQAISAEIARIDGLSKPPALAQGGPEADMIQQMVSRLAEKLKQNPDDPQGWARLVRSYTVIGDKAKKDAALAEARRIFKDRPKDLATIEQADKAPQGAEDVQGALGARAR